MEMIILNKSYGWTFLANIEDTSSEQLKLIIPGILAKIVLTKEIFSKNDDLKEFTKIFAENSYAEYLYRARPLLYSRLIKEFIKLESNQEVFDYFKLIRNFLIHNEVVLKVEEVKEDNLKDITKKNTISNDIKSWSKFINPGRYNED